MYELKTLCLGKLETTDLNKPEQKASMPYFIYQTQSQLIILVLVLIEVSSTHPWVL